MQKPLSAAYMGKGIEVDKLCSQHFEAFWRARILAEKPGTYESLETFGYTPQEAVARMKAKLAEC